MFCVPLTASMHSREIELQVTLKLGQHYSLLFLVLTFAVSVADFAGLVTLKEQYLAKSLICVDFSG